MSAPFILMRCASHRARDKALGAIGGEHLGVYCFSITGGGSHRGLYVVTPQEYERARGVKGVTRCRLSPHKLGVCYSERKSDAVTRARLSEWRASTPEAV